MATLTFEITDKLEFDAALRYDEDTRKNTTETPTGIPAGSIRPSTGEVRKHTFSEWQPKATLRYKPTDNLTFFGGWSRGFRSGGFNQTGVGAVADASGIAGVNDLFEAEVADTWEVGVKGQTDKRHVSGGLSLFSTKSENGYFFVFLAANSTQNLGNLDPNSRAPKLELTLRPVERLELTPPTAHQQQDHEDGRHERGGQRGAAGHRRHAQPQRAICAAAGRGPGPDPAGGLPAPGPHLVGTLQCDVPRPGSLLDARIGLGTATWNVTAWGKNLTDEKYNTEFSPGGFLFKALPRRYGVEFNYRF